MEKYNWLSWVNVQWRLKLIMFAFLTKSKASKHNLSNVAQSRFRFSRVNL